MFFPDLLMCVLTLDPNIYNIKLKKIHLKKIYFLSPTIFPQFLQFFYNKLYKKGVGDRKNC